MAGRTFDHVTDDQTAAIADEGWPYVLLTGDSVITGDTEGDVLDELIDGYADIPAGDEGDRAALFTRAGYATGQAQLLQETLAALALNAGDWNLGVDLDAEFVLLGDRAVPVETVAEWIHPVPLVLIATDYAPYTDRPAPYGNVVWLDPYSDTTFLTTLSEAGLAVLHVRADLERTAVG